MLLFFLSLALNFHAQQSFYIVRRFFSPRYSSCPTPFVVDFPSGRFFSPRSPIISPSAGCPSSSWSFARLSVAYTLISRLTQSLCSCLLLSFLRAAVDLSLLPARRPSCLRDSVLLVCLHSSSHLFLSLSLSLLSSSQIRSSSDSGEHALRPSRSLVDRIARKRFATTAAATAATERERSARYMRETQKGKKDAFQRL